MTIPRSPEDITPAWLGSVLGTDVREVDVTAIGTGQTGATYRVTATYPEGPEPASAPATFAVKLPAQDDAARERVALGYLSEVDFYSAITSNVAIPAPGCFHSEISSDGADFVLLLADLAPAVQGFDLPSIVMPKPGDAEAAKGLGDVAVMAGQHHLGKTRRVGQR